MRTFQILVASLAVAVPVAVGGCTASTEPEETTNDDELRALAPGEIVGTIAYGQTLGPLPYTERPLYRALRFVAAKGDKVDIWVRSAGGDARAWLTASTFATLASNDDARAGQKDSHIAFTTTRAGTYYIVWREKNREDATFEVSLTGGPPPITGPITGPITTPGFTATPGAYPLTGACGLVGSTPAAASAVATVTTQPDGTRPQVTIHALSEPSSRAAGFFPLPLAGSELAEEGGLLAQWSYTEVDRLVTKRGTFRQTKNGPGSYSLLLEGSMDIDTSPYGAMRCAFGFSAPFVRPAPTPAALPLGVPLDAAGTCSVTERYPYACVPGTPGRDAYGCCVHTSTVSAPDSISFQLDAAGGSRSLRVLQAPVNARNVSGLTVPEAAGAFDARPALHASTVQQSFTLSTLSESSDAVQCGTRVVTRSCRLVLAP